MGMTGRHQGLATSMAVKNDSLVFHISITEKRRVGKADGVWSNKETEAFGVLVCEPNIDAIFQVKTDKMFPLFVRI